MQTGQCLCGAVRYDCDGDIGPSNYCHCADCRRTTGSAFNIGVRVRAQDFRITGPVRAFIKAGDSGNSLSRHFCAVCGSPIYTSSPSHPEFLFVKAGTVVSPDVV